MTRFRNRQIMLNVRLDATEKRMLERAARRAGMAVSVWIRYIIREHATRNRWSSLRKAESYKATDGRRPR